jgi:hypothetical protein
MAESQSHLPSPLQKLIVHGDPSKALEHPAHFKWFPAVQSVVIENIFPVVAQHKTLSMAFFLKHVGQCPSLQQVLITEMCLQEQNKLDAYFAKVRRGV